MDASDDTPREREQVAQWVRLAKMEKHIFGWPTWQLHSPRQSKAGEVPNRADQFVLSALLTDGAGVSIEGLELRMVAWRDRPQEDATALLQVAGDGWTAISRLDCWPTAPHVNTFWRKLRQTPNVERSHVHLCEDNARLGRRAFKPLGNLPSAVEVDTSPHSFRDMVRLVERYFNINGASAIEPPDWQGRLL